MKKVCATAAVACTAAVGALLCVPGCGLDKAYPSKDTFVISAGAAHPAADTRPEILRVETVNLSPPYDERGLVFRVSDVTARPDYYNVFVADPEDLLTGELVRVLTDAKAFTGVLEPASTASFGLRLECMVTDFYVDLRDPAKRVGVCRARYRLLREEPGRTVVAGDWQTEASAPVSSDTGAAGAAALGSAFGRTVEDFVKKSAR